MGITGKKQNTQRLPTFWLQLLISLKYYNCSILELVPINHIVSVSKIPSFSVATDDTNYSTNSECIKTRNLQKYTAYIKSSRSSSQSNCCIHTVLHLCTYKYAGVYTYVYIHTHTHTHMYIYTHKAFDTIPRQVLISKLLRYGFEGYIIQWISNCLDGCSKRIVASRSISMWRMVTSGVLQGFI